MKTLRPALWLPIFAAATSLACSSYSSYTFGPALRDVEVRTNDGSEVIASVLVSVRGIAKSGDDAHEVRFRLRLQNRRPSALQVAGAELVDAELTPFGPVRIEPAPGPIEPGGEALYAIAFPFPSGRDPGDLDFSALNLRVTLAQGDASWTWSAGFERVYDQYPYDPYYWDPYWGPHPWYGFGFHTGVVWCH